MSLIPLPPADVLPELLPGEDTNELQIMISGHDYGCMDPYLVRLRERACIKVRDWNQLYPTEKRMEAMIGWCQFKNIKSVSVMPTLTLEYGFNVSFGDSVYIGPNCTLIDVAPITIGDRVMIGANAQIYTPTHPLAPEIRNAQPPKEAASAVVIEDDCWIGGGAIILPGVTIGAGSTVGAGTVVTKNVPPRSVVVGNPGRVIKTIEADGTIVNVKK